MAPDPEVLADELRTLANRLEDGGVKVQCVVLAIPRFKTDSKGEFRFTFAHEEEASRWQRVYERATEAIQHTDD